MSAPPYPVLKGTYMDYRQRRLTPSMLKLEEKHSKSIEKIIIETVDRTGSLVAAAKELGMTDANLSVWLRRLNLRVKTIVVIDE
jgi:transcriptional regulator with GAF, ATPase, and Fis domain